MPPREDRKRIKLIADETSKVLRYDLLSREERVEYMFSQMEAVLSILDESKG